MHTIVTLTPDRLEQLRAAQVPCAGCLRWELDPVRRGRVHGAGATAEEKRTWVSTVLREWGSCGRIILVDGDVAGYIAYAPAAFVPGGHGFATAPVSADAVLLTTTHVVPEHRDAGVGRILVQAMAADLIERGGVQAVEAFGRSPAILAPGGACLIPSQFLAHVGFKTVRPHRSAPRMRMDLRSTVTWREEVEAALGRLVGAVRPVPAPETARSLRDAKGPA